jgi:ssDNA-binding Zn-finger/Zn-ribbon topoisomerase 1
MFNTPANDNRESSGPDTTTKPEEATGARCPTCGEQMQLVHAQPDQRYTKLDVATYTCECGQDVDLLIARAG